MNDYDYCKHGKRLENDCPGCDEERANSGEIIVEGRIIDEDGRMRAASTKEITTWQQDAAKVLNKLSQHESEMLTSDVKSGVIALGLHHSFVAKPIAEAVNQLQMENIRLRSVIEWIAAQSDLFFAECAQAEEIVTRCKEALFAKSKLGNLGDRCNCGAGPSDDP